MSVSQHELFTPLKRGSAPTHVSPELGKGNQYRRSTAFSEALTDRFTHYQQYQNEIDALLAVGDTEGADVIRQLAAQQRDAEVSNRRVYPISPKRQGYIDTIVKQPYKLMLTVASPLLLSDQDNIDNLWFLCKKVNGYFFRRSFSKHRNQGLTGHIAAEPHTFSCYLRGSLHFHVLLTQPPEIADIDEFREVVLEYAPHVKDRNKNAALDVSMIDVRPILDLPNYNLLGVAQYVTKSMEHYLFKEGEYQMPLTPLGIDGKAIRSWNEIANY